MPLPHTFTVVLILAGVPLVVARQPEPQTAEEFLNRGGDWFNKGEFDKAIADCDEAIRLDPNYALAYYLRGRAWAAKKEYDKAIKDYTEAIRLAPEAHVLFLCRGHVWFARGEFDKAIADYTEVIKLAPTSYAGFLCRGNAWYSKGEYDKAIADFTEAIRLAPRNAVAYCNRGHAWFHKGEYDKALGDYTEAIKLDPKDPDAFNGRAWLLATCPEDRSRDGKRAVADARRACELAKWKDPTYFSTLAAAYAEDGQFDEAVKWQKKALEDETLTRGQRGGYQARLKLYEQKQPYRVKKP